jgi:hypothetical protein
MVWTTGAEALQWRGFCCAYPLIIARYTVQPKTSILSGQFASAHRNITSLTHCLTKCGIVRVILAP